ncbi:MAG: hypothetical protein WKI04_18670, partial [Ferruginibacter sp.]
NDWFMSTHYIMDSFAFGGLLAVGKFVFPNIFSVLVSWKHWLLLPAFLLLVPLFLLPPGNLFMNSIGISMMFGAFAMLLAYSLSVEDFSRSKQIISLVIIQPLAAIGVASYSIYLFHVPLKTIIDSISMNEWFRSPAYFIACIAVGKITWYIIERPIALYKSRLSLQKEV